MGELIFLEKASRCAQLDWLFNGTCIHHRSDHVEPSKKFRIKKISVIQHWARLDVIRKLLILRSQPDLGTWPRGNRCNEAERRECLTNDFPGSVVFTKQNIQIRHQRLDRDMKAWNDKEEPCVCVYIKNDCAVWGIGFPFLSFSHPHSKKINAYFAEDESLFTDTNQGSPSS